MSRPRRSPDPDRRRDDDSGRTGGAKAPRDADRTVLSPSGDSLSGDGLSGDAGDQAGDGQTQIVPGGVDPSDSRVGPADGRGAKFAAGQRVFGRYRIVRELGRGGMGVVFLARDTQIDRDVALKIPAVLGREDSEIGARFLREARAAGTLRHPNVCPVYDAGEQDGRLFMTMAYLPGRSLQDAVDGPQPVRSTVRLIGKLADAMAHAHDRGVVHRDLKPGNVMLDDRGRPHVTDFGLARRESEDARVTRSGATLGTPAYMSPEQIRGELDAIGPPADIYALGVMLYQLLTGRLPYEGSATTVLGKALTEDPPPLRQLRAEIDPDLEAIWKRMTARDPADRFESMRAVRDALVGYLKDSPRTIPVGRAGDRSRSRVTSRRAAAHTRRATPPAPVGRPGEGRPVDRRLRRRAAAAGAAALLGLAATLAIAFHGPADADATDVIAAPDAGPDVAAPRPPSPAGTTPGRTKPGRTKPGRTKPGGPTLVANDDAAATDQEPIAEPIAVPQSGLEPTPDLAPWSVPGSLVGDAGGGETPPEGWTELFDGRSLENWSAAEGGAAGRNDATAGAAGWSVVDGVLTADFPDALPVGGRIPAELTSAAEYEDHEVRLVVRRSDALSAEAFVRRADDAGAYVADLSASPAYSSFGALRGQTFVRSHPRVARSQVPPEITALARSARATNGAPPGWDVLRIRVVGPRVAAAVNGVMTASARFPDLPPRGRLGLSLSPLREDPSRLEVRSIRVRPLSEEDRTEADVAPEVPPRPPAASDAPGWVDLFDGRSLDDWTGDPDVWRVEEGVLIGEVAADRPRGAGLPPTYPLPLTHAAVQADGEWRFVFRCVNGQLSSVVVRERRERLEPEGGVQAYLHQIPLPSITGVLRIYDDRPGGRLQVPVGIDRALRAHTDEPQGWDVLTLRVTGTEVLSWLNGVPIAREYSTHLPPTGACSLKLHYNESRANRLEFRSVRFRPADGPSGEP